MKWFIAILALVLSACSQSGGQPDAAVSTVQPTYTNYSAPSICAPTSMGSVAFAEWGALNGSSYSCALATGMTCTLSISDDKAHAQVVCLGSGSNLPSSCAGFEVNSTGGTPTHEFLDGSFDQAAAYDCGEWNNLRCSFFAGSNGENEMRCLDNDLPYENGFSFAN